MGLTPADWVRLIQPDCEDEWVTGFKTNYAPKKGSRLDSVLEIADPDEPYLLNLELMGYRDTALPARMLRYRSDIWSMLEYACAVIRVWEGKLVPGKGNGC